MPAAKGLADAFSKAVLLPSQSCPFENSKLCFWKTKAALLKPTQALPRTYPGPPKGRVDYQRGMAERTIVLKQTIHPDTLTTQHPDNLQPLRFPLRLKRLEISSLFVC